jgi:hypothetical protein
MRLSGLGSVAVGLMGVVWLSSATLLISFCLGAPANGRLARQFAVAQIERMDNSLAAIERAMPRQDWAAAAQELKEARSALASLAEEAAAIPSLKTRNEPATVEDLRRSLDSAQEALAAAGRAIAKKDAPEVAAASERYRKTTTPMREAAKRAGEQFTMGGIVPGQE